MIKIKIISTRNNFLYNKQRSNIYKVWCPLNSFSNQEKFYQKIKIFIDSLGNERLLLFVYD